MSHFGIFQGFVLAQFADVFYIKATYIKIFFSVAFKHFPNIIKLQQLYKYAVENLILPFFALTLRFVGFLTTLTLRFVRFLDIFNIAYYSKARK